MSPEAVNKSFSYEDSLNDTDSLDSHLEDNSQSHAHKEVWLTPKGTLSPRDRRALRSSARKNHSSKLPDGSLIFRGKRLLKKKCMLCD